MSKNLGASTALIVYLSLGRKQIKSEDDGDDDFKSNGQEDKNHGCSQF